MIPTDTEMNSRKDKVKKKLGITGCEQCQISFPEGFPQGFCFCELVVFSICGRCSLVVRISRGLIFRWYELCIHADFPIVAAHAVVYIIHLYRHLR